jgi:hypothetical protein
MSFTLTPLASRRRRKIHLWASPQMKRTFSWRLSPKRSIQNSSRIGQRWAISCRRDTSRDGMRASHSEGGQGPKNGRSSSIDSSLFSSHVGSQNLCVIPTSQAASYTTDRLWVLRSISALASSAIRPNSWRTIVARIISLSSACP